MTAQYQTWFERLTQFDTAAVLAWAFFVCFGLLVFWLRREDKREGYPLVDGTPAGRPIQGFPEMPGPKVIRRLFRHDLVQMPHHHGSSKARGRRLLRFPGAPLVPVGNPLLAEIGPGAFPLREDEPLLSYGEPQVVPLRAAHGWRVPDGETDLRGMAVFDQQGAPVGAVFDVWVDRGVKILRYLEVVLSLPDAPGRHVLVPIHHASVHARHNRIAVRSLLAYQFPDTPPHANPDGITAREEDRLNAFHAAGLLFSRGRDGGLPLPRGAVEGP